MAPDGSVDIHVKCTFPSRADVRALQTCTPLHVDHGVWSLAARRGYSGTESLRVGAHCTFVPERWWLKDGGTRFSGQLRGEQGTFIAGSTSRDRDKHARVRWNGGPPSASHSCKPSCESPCEMRSPPGGAPVVSRPSGLPALRGLVPLSRYGGCGASRSRWRYPNELHMF